MIDYFSALIAGHGIIAIFSSLAIGILTSLAPCSLVGLPLIAGFAANLNAGTNISDRVKYTRRFTIIFVLGVVVSITLLFIMMTQFKYALGSSPLIAYLLIGLLTLYIGLAALGLIRGISIHQFVERFARFNLIGAFIIGLFVGVISSPCASPAIISIIIVAQKQSFLYSLFLVLAFALGHSMVLLLSGFSITFIDRINKRRTISYVATGLQKSLALLMIFLGGYFLYKAYMLGVIL